MLNDRDLMAVQRTCEGMTDSVTIFAHGPVAEDDFERNLMAVATQISGVSSNRIAVEDAPEPVIPGKPSLTLSAGDNGNIHYLATPEQTELAPFLEAVGRLGNSGDQSDPKGLEAIRDLKQPVRLMVLMAMACPHCPAVIRSALRLAVGRPQITLTIVDAMQFTDLAAQYKVKSTPTTIINEGHTVVGQVSLEDLAGLVARVEAPETLTDTLKSMIEAGRVEDAAARMCELKAPEALLPLYKSPDFSMRMGVLVVLEEALEIDPRSLDSMVDELTKLLFTDDVALKGDTSELLGNIGSPAAIPALKKIENDPDEDVREAVAEALEALAGTEG